MLPGFDRSKKYPLLLEIHGGPVSNYGPRFAAEIQLYAAAGYVVLYTNPRGSNSYGQEFGNLIHHNYPGEDYDDLMSGIDAVIARGYIDDRNLFVTGGSGGGVLTSWVVGRTDRFRAAVSAKPVNNCFSLPFPVAMQRPTGVCPQAVPGLRPKYASPNQPVHRREVLGLFRLSRRVSPYREYVTLLPLTNTQGAGTSLHDFPPPEPQALR